MASPFANCLTFSWTNHDVSFSYWEASSYYTSRKLQTQNSISEEMDQFGLPFSPILNELIFPGQEQGMTTQFS